MITIQLKTSWSPTAVVTTAATVLKAPNAPTEREADKKADAQQNSTRVTLSDFGKRQFQQLQNMAIQVQKLPNNANNARKAAALAQALHLKQQIETLKKIAASLGPMAAKGILRQIKQIAQQIRQVAAELGPSSSPLDAAVGGMGNLSGPSVSENTNAEAKAGEGEAQGEGGAQGQSLMENGVAARQATPREAEAETAAAETEDVAATGKDAAATQEGAAVAQAEQAASEAEKEVEEKEEGKAEGREKDGLMGGMNALSDQYRAVGEQENNDVKLLRDLLKEFRVVLSLVKGAMPHKDKKDKEDFEDIDEQLEEADKLTQDLEDSAKAYVADAEALSSLAAQAPVSVDHVVAETSISVFA